MNGKRVERFQHSPVRFMLSSFIAMIPLKRKDDGVRKWMPVRVLLWCWQGPLIRVCGLMLKQLNINKPLHNTCDAVHENTVREEQASVCVVQWFITTTTYFSFSTAHLCFTWLCWLWAQAILYFFEILWQSMLSSYRQGGWPSKEAAGIS